MYDFDGLSIQDILAKAGLPRATRGRTPGSDDTQRCLVLEGARSQNCATQMTRLSGWLFRRADPGYFEWTRAGLASGIVILICGHEVWPGRVALDPSVLGAVALLVLLVALPLIEEFSVPGGFSAKMRKELRGAEESVARLRIGTATEESQTGTEDAAAAELRDESGEDLPAYLARLAEQQPRAGLLALAAELEDRLRQTYRQIYEVRPPQSMLELVRQLLRDEHIDADQADVALRLLDLGRQAAQARQVGANEAGQAVSYGEALISSMRRAAASPREFEASVARELERLGGAQIRHRVLIHSELAEHPLEADFIVEHNAKRYLIEARLARTPASLAAALRGAKLLAYSALQANEADESVLVVPDGVDLPPDSSTPELRVVELAQLAETLKASSHAPSPAGSTA
jgi:hypothetical protein